MVRNCRRCIRFIPASVTFDDLGWPTLSSPGELRKLLAETLGKPLRVNYVPMRGETCEHWEYVGWLALAAKDMVVYVDEIDTLCSTQALKPPNTVFWNKPENKTRSPVLNEIINRGRHQGIALVMMSRVPTQVNTLLRSQSREMRIFGSNDPNYVGWFEAKDGRLASLLPTLRKYQYVLWQDGHSPVVSGGRR